MTDICQGDLADVVRVLNLDFGWVCEPVSDDRAIFYSGRRYADSEPVAVHIFVRGDIVALSDGGEVASRLNAAGFHLDDSINLGVWREALWEFRLSFADDVVHLTASHATAPDAAVRLADALLGLDSLRLLAVPTAPRVKTFADTVEDYLRSTVGDSAVARSPLVEVEGISVRPTLLVTAKKGPVYVQATATTAVTQAFEHAFYMFSLLERAGVPRWGRLAVLGGSELTWTRPRLNVLSEVANVELWANREGVQDYFAHL